MPSTLNNICDTLKSQISQATGIKTVEDWPNDVTVWLETVRISPDRMPVAHISIDNGQSAITASTDNDIGETIKITVTVLFSYNGNNRTAMVNLRDAIIDSVCSVNNQTLNGYALLTEYTGWQFVAQYQDLALIKINLSVLTQYSLA